MVDDIIYDIEVRYNGFFKQIKRKERVIYHGGSVFTLTVELDRTCLKDLVEEITALREYDSKTICRLAYAIPNTTPTRFAFLNTDIQYMEMLREFSHKRKCTIYVCTEIKTLPIRMMYNHRTLKEKLLKGVVNDIPHFVMEDEEWNWFFEQDRGKEIIPKGLAVHEEETLEPLKGLEVDPLEPLKGLEELATPKLSAACSLEVDPLEEVDILGTPKLPAATKKSLQQPRGSPRLNKEKKISEVAKKLQYCSSKCKATKTHVRGFSEEVQYVNEEAEIAEASFDDMELIMGGEEVKIDNEDVVEDGLDDCYSQDSYHSLQSSAEEDLNLSDHSGDNEVDDF